jgi:hypothetical protein
VPRYFFKRRVIGEHFTENPQFPDAAGNEVTVLPPEVQDNNHLLPVLNGHGVDNLPVPELKKSPV